MSLKKQLKTPNNEWFEKLKENYLFTLELIGIPTLRSRPAIDWKKKVNKMDCDSCYTGEDVRLLTEYWGDIKPTVEKLGYNPTKYDKIADGLEDCGLLGVVN